MFFVYRFVLLMYYPQNQQLAYTKETQAYRLTWSLHTEVRKY